MTYFETFYLALAIYGVLILARIAGEAGRIAKDLAVLRLSAQQVVSAYVLSGAFGGEAKANLEATLKDQT